MMIERDFSGSDPRLQLSADELRAATLRAAPEVARPARAGDGLALACGILGAMALGAFTLVSLSRAREATPEELASAAIPALIPQEVPPIAAATPQAKVPAAGKKSVSSVMEPDPGQSRSMPMIIDNTTPAALANAAGHPRDAAASGAQPAGLTQDELFAMRTGNDNPPVARAVSLGDPAQIVVQGTIIPAVLETALNSDLPGFVRAIVSRDVRSFDGSQALIPRGSRLIGQYKSALVTGQSRAFIIWTRLIRPDGRSVQLASPVMDEGGEVGLAGEVKRHFWQRFGSSILLSIVAGLANSVGDGTNAVVIGTSGAQSAATVALETDGKIPPTIRIPLGTPIQVFAARDLDFSA